MVAYNFIISILSTKEESNQTWVVFHSSSKPEVEENMHLASWYDLSAAILPPSPPLSLTHAHTEKEKCSRVHLCINLLPNSIGCGKMVFDLAMFLDLLKFYCSFLHSGTIGFLCPEEALATDYLLFYVSVFLCQHWTENDDKKFNTLSAILVYVAAFGLNNNMIFCF